MMNTYISKTGYVKRKNTNDVYEVTTIYLGIYDNKDNYEDISRDDYDEIIKNNEVEVKKNGNN